MQPPKLDGLDSLQLEEETLFGAITEARVHKTAEEVALMKYVNNIGSEAHVAMMQVCMVETSSDTSFPDPAYHCIHVCYKIQGL